MSLTGKELTYRDKVHFICGGDDRRRHIIRRISDVFEEEKMTFEEAEDIALLLKMLVEVEQKRLLNKEPFRRTTDVHAD